jgi:chemotaxis protein methyltransferase CheR
MENGEIPLSDKEFARIRERVYKIAGISLSDAKRTLVVSRLSKIVRALGLSGFSAYIDYLETKGSAEDDQSFVNALTTNLTRFFREDHHFDHLISHVGNLMEHRSRTSRGRPRLRIWSAGCSTGQEPYTIALCLLDALPELKRWDFRILATDIDSNVVAKAATGVYPIGELNGLSAQRTALFEKAGPDTIRIPRAAHEMISFKLLNLIEPWPVKGPFDAIFCRNVAIYFDKPTQGTLFDRLGRVLAPDGFLYIGHSENLQAVSSGFKLVGKTIYQLKAKQDAKDAA